MDEKTNRRNLIMVPLGTVWRGLVYSLVTSFLLTFVLFTRSLTSAKLSAITAIMVGARIFDALNAGTVMLGGTDLKFLLITICYMLADFGQYGFCLILMTSVINKIEYNKYLHGTRSEGIITSLRPFPTKLASALTIVIAHVTFLLTHVTHCTGELSTIHELLRGVSHGQSLGLLLVVTALPCARRLISYFMYLKRYKPKEPEYNHICEELCARRAQKIA